MKTEKQKYNTAFTLVETLISIAVIVIVSIALYGLYTKMFSLLVLLKQKSVAAGLANEQFELAHNLPYTDVGTVGGIPNGKLHQSQTLTRDGIPFSVTTTVRNVDLPFDGTIGGSPNDLSPSDNKLVEISIECPTCKNFTPLTYTSRIGPKNLETASTNGALVIKAFDANGLPVEGATVHVTNANVLPVVDLTDVTGVDGSLQIVDAIPSIANYAISVTKNGYSTDRTYAVGSVAGANPVKPDQTVAIQQVTQASFAIDKTSTLNVSSIQSACQVVPNIDFTMSGTKLIGTSPDVKKYSTSHVTNGSGVKTISSLEWDTYDIALTDGTYDLIGTNPLLSLGLTPDVVQNLKLIVAPKSGDRLLVVVRDQSTGLPIADATVTLTKSGVSTIKTTGRGFITQTDWSGGGSQAVFIDDTKYLSADNTTATTDITLHDSFGTYVSDGELVSSAFDMGEATNFSQITWTTSSLPPSSGANAVRMQLATNNDNATWNFIGPDGTSASYYDLTNQNINTVHNGNRYIRYKLLLHTDDTAVTPSVSDISFTYTSDCVPPGQVAFSNLQSGGTYTIDIEKSGYQDSSIQTTISSAWQKQEINITP